MGIVKYTLNDVKDIVEPYGYELVSKKYKNVSEKLDMICNSGHKCSISLDKFKRGRRCRECDNDRKRKQQRTMTTKQVAEHVSTFGYKLVSEEYKGLGYRVELKCDQGHLYETTMANFNEGRRCQICKKINRLNEIKDNVESRGFKLLTNEYLDNYNKIEVECPHGHISSVGTHSFTINGTGCRKCADIENGQKQKLSYDEVKVFIESNDYVLLSDSYENSTSKLKVMCPQNHEYEVSYGNFYMGKRCPYCISSNGEARVRKFLDENNIAYESQFRFSDCRYKHTLPFDFYIPHLNTLIEYDGIQHFDERYGFGSGVEGLAQTKRNDSIKTNYASANNIKLIRIPYWEFDNIESILNNKLKMTSEKTSTTK